MTFACFPMKGLFRPLLKATFCLVFLTVFGVSLSTIVTAQMVMDIDHEMKANKLHPDDSKIVDCPNQQTGDSLPAGDYNSNLHVVGECIADGTQGNGIYKYHWIFVHDGGSLIFQDKKLDLYASSILVMNGGAVRAGSADNNGAITGPLTIHLWGGQDDAAIPCETANGKVDYTCGVSTWDTSNKMDKIYPTTPCAVDPKIGDCFYQYDDPAQSFLYFGRKVLAVSYGGTLQLFGKKGSTFDGVSPTPSNTGKSWTRLTTNLGIDENEFEVAGEMDWQPGDHIVISPTDYLPGHAEEAIIASSDYDSAADTTEIKISSVVLDDGTVKNGGVRFPHNGTAYPIPSDVKDQLGLDRDSVDTRAAVGLLTRNIRIVSEGPNGPDTSKGTDPYFPPDAGNFFGGHLIFRQGFKQVQLQGVEFFQLGQGGLLGRYAVHFHMDRKVPADTFEKDCSMDESMTRWLTIHGTQGLLAARNVGWKSIGHGFFIEDGTETDNKLYANLGVLARAGVKNSQNPRAVPGILANKDVGEVRAPYNSDWQHPSVFWIMNGWNDFEYNMAAGAGSCGMCYWLTAGANSGPSRYEYWTGYAARQRGLIDAIGQREYNAGTSPLQKFVGNACSTAMFSFMELGNPDFSCLGFGAASENPKTVAAVPGMGPSVPQVNIPSSVYNYYPITSGNRNPSKCPDEKLQPDCGANVAFSKCGGTSKDDEQNCMVTTLDHYTTSFNWSEKNFSSIWMRNWWKLVTDSSITDQLGGGLTMVTGGGYTRSDSSLGNWLVGLRNVFVGQTQKDPTVPAQKFYASNVGPVTPNGIQCDNGNPGGYCLSAANGVSYLLTPFNSGQRMFNIYDGPSFQDSSAYLNVKARAISDCTPQENGGVCDTSKFMYGHAVGLLQGTPNPDKPDQKECYIPNAAIAWKQENGFYYPPAFFSRNLVFRDVDIRHFVVEPLFQLNTFQLNVEEASKRYCTWNNQIFDPFTDIDRQTVLNDTDGSLTGLLANTTPPRETLSINEDVFFRAPNLVPECSSDKHYTMDQRGAPATAITSPHEYLTTAIISDCVRTPDVCISGDNPCTKWDYRRECGIDKDDGQRNWTEPGSNAYGVPLFRQYWTQQDNADCEKDARCKNGDPLARPGRITMMGQSTGQRSTLTANDSWYYIDTTVPASKQKTGAPNQVGRSVFLSGHNYYAYLVYGIPTTNMKYWMYVGKGADEKTVEDAVGRYRVNVDSDNYGFNKAIIDDKNPDFLTDVEYDPMSGWLKVTINLSGYAKEFADDKENFCKPASYCSWNGKSCGCASGSDCKDDSVCAWGTQPPDCPTKGCFGFSFKIQPQFDQFDKPGPPMWTAFPENAVWNVATKGVDKDKSGAECYYPPTGKQW